MKAISLLNPRLSNCDIVSYIFYWAKQSHNWPRHKGTSSWSDSPPFAYLTFPCLGFLVCKMGIINVFIQQKCMEYRVCSRWLRTKRRISWSMFSSRTQSRLIEEKMCIYSFFQQIFNTYLQNTNRSICINPCCVTEWNQGCKGQVFFFSQTAF